MDQNLKLSLLDRALELMKISPRWETLDAAYIEVLGAFQGKEKHIKESSENLWSEGEETFLPNEGGLELNEVDLDIIDDQGYEGYIRENTEEIDIENQDDVFYVKEECVLNNFLKPLIPHPANHFLRKKDFFKMYVCNEDELLTSNYCVVDEEINPFDIESNYNIIWTIGNYWIYAHEYQLLKKYSAIKDIQYTPQKFTNFGIENMDCKIEDKFECDYIITVTGILK